MIEPRLSPSARVLDVGAGSEHDYKYPYSGKVARLVGIDLGKEVLENPVLDEAYCCDAVQMPFADASFDLAFSDYVFEHLAQPHAVLDEIYRVLKPGGWLFVRTPNKWQERR